jgi:hypothetical protein
MFDTRAASTSAAGWWAIKFSSVPHGSARVSMIV